MSLEITGGTGEQGPAGPAGPQGDPGPNEVTTATATDITGLLKGNGSLVSAAVENTDYAAATHASRHASGGADSIKLDDLALPDDNTDLNVSTSRHGLVPKAPGGATGGLLRPTNGTWGPAEVGNLLPPLVANTFIGSGVAGFSVEWMDYTDIPLDAIGAPSDNTTLDASTSAHGLMQKYPGGTTTFLRADGTFATPTAAGTINTLRTTANQTINGGAGVFVDITGLTFPVVSGTDYAFDFYITFQSAQTTTGWRAGVNCPAGTLDFWAGSDVIANGAAGVATHTERHNTVRDDMTLLTSTVTNNVDLNVRIRGRYLCTANGTFAARFANELAANTNVVVQKGSWGIWF